MVIKNTTIMDMELLSQVQAIKDYGSASHFPVFTKK